MINYNTTSVLCMAYSLSHWKHFSDQVESPQCSEFLMRESILRETLLHIALSIEDCTLLRFSKSTKTLRTMIKR